MLDLPVPRESVPCSTKVARAVDIRERRRSGHGQASLRLAIVRALLETNAEPAFVLDERGRVRIANFAGRKQLENDASDLLARLAACPARGSEHYRACTVVRGLTRWKVLIERPVVPGFAERLRFAAQRWELHARHADVLAHLAHGKTNASIAAELGLATKTVEFHVATLLARADVENRASLVASFWTLE